MPLLDHPVRCIIFNNSSRLPDSTLILNPQLHDHHPAHGLNIRLNPLHANSLSNTTGNKETVAWISLWQIKKSAEIVSKQALHLKMRCYHRDGEKE